MSFQKEMFRVLGQSVFNIVTLIMMNYFNFQAFSYSTEFYIGAYGGLFLWLTVTIMDYYYTYRKYHPKEAQE